MDMGASVIARLKNKAKETGKPFQLHLQLFCQEEFLRRLAASRYAENLVLKGGLFIYTLTNFESRATVDIDFLYNNSPEGLRTSNAWWMRLSPWTAATILLHLLPGDLKLFLPSGSIPASVSSW